MAAQTATAKAYSVIVIVHSATMPSQIVDATSTISDLKAHTISVVVPHSG